MRYWLLVVFFLCLAASCEKNKTNCSSLPPSNSIWGYNTVIDTPYLGQPYFNPNNSNEFLYVEGVLQDRLYIYNLLSGTKKLLFEGSILFPPKWSSKNWILLNLGDENIWKIKGNGDSLSQLTFGGGNYYGEWNSTGNRFIFKRGNSLGYITLVANENGMVIDTFPFPISPNSSWQHPNYLVFASYANGLVKIDISTKVIDPLYSIKEEDVDGMYIYNNNIVWCSQGKLLSTDIVSLETYLIHSSCQTIYRCPSSNGNKILMQRIHREYKGDNTLKKSSSLVLMNTDGTNEKDIAIY
jgi:hypothetical protein